MAGNANLANPAKSFADPDQAFVKFMDLSGKPIAQLKKSDGEWLSNNEFKASDLNEENLGVYRKFRDWYGGHGAEWVAQGGGPEPRPQRFRCEPTRSKRVSELVRLADGLAASLKGGAGG